MGEFHKMSVTRNWIIIILLAIVITPIASYAQSGYTQVTALVQDSNGSKYVNAPYTVTFFDPGTSGKLPLLSGSTFQKNYNGYATDSSGNLSISLPDNSVIASTSGATNTQWVFNICTAVGAYTTQFCIPTVFITISGNSQNISSNLTAVAPLLPVITPTSLKTNGVINPTQTILNLISGSNVTLTPDGSGGVTINAATGGAANPSSPAFSLQYANSSVTGFVGAAGVTTPDGNSLDIKGPIPFAGLEKFARSQPGTTACSAAATISLGSPTTATLSNNTCFQNGDGITINGAGAATGLSTPVLSTITPASLAIGGMEVGGGTGTPYATVAGTVGATTDSYTLVVRDKFGGYSAASTPVSTSTALAALGLISCPITSMSRSGVNVMVNFTSGCEGAVVGAAMSIAGTTGDSSMQGIYNIQTVNSSSQVVATSQYNSASFGWNVNPTGANSVTGGTGYFMGSNHLQWAAVTGAWYYYVCAKRSGDSNYHLIGHTFPSSSIYLDLQFDDYGSPYMDSQLYPTYIETGSDVPNSNDAICTNNTGLPDPLTTTVTLGGGTTSVTLANAATTAVTNATAKFDDGPGLLAAANSVKNSGSLAGRVTIPATKFFIINSYTQLPANVTIEGAGAVKYNETVELQAGTRIDDSKGGPFGCQFCYWSTGGALNYLGAAYPAIYISGNNVKLTNMAFLTESNYNGHSVVVNDGSNTFMDNVEFIMSSGSDDYLSTAIAWRNSGSSNPDVLEMKNVNFTASMTSAAQITTWDPYILVPGLQNGSGACAGGQGGVISIDGVGMYQRGFLNTVCNTGGMDWQFKHINRQSGIAPFLWVESGPNSRATSSAMYDLGTLDTSGGGYLMVGNATGNCSLMAVNIITTRLNGTGQFEGCGPTNYRDSYNTATGTLPNYSGKVQNCAQGSISGSLLLTMNCNFDYDAYIGPNAKIYFPLGAPTSPTATAISGGSLNCPSCTFQFEIVANDLAGQSSIGSAAATSTALSGTCPGSGNCQLSVGWTISTGAVNYTVFGCQVGSSGLLFQCPTYTNIPGAGTNTTSNPVTLNSLGGGTNNPPSFALGGQAGMNSTNIWGLTFLAYETAAPTCYPNNDLFWGDSTAHRLKMCNNNSSPDTVVGAATTDILTNKTYDTAGSGNVLKINGNQVSSISGNTAKVQLESGSTTTNDAAKFDANGNIIDAGLSGTLNVCGVVQIALTTGAIASGARATNTGTCTGLSTSTDTINCSFNSDTNAVTGYAPSASGGLSLKIWISTNTINVDQVNDTGASITPGAATVNCKGIR